MQKKKCKWLLEWKLKKKNYNATCQMWLHARKCYKKYIAQRTQKVGFVEEVKYLLR